MPVPASLIASIVSAVLEAATQSSTATQNPQMYESYVIKRTLPPEAKLGVLAPPTGNGRVTLSDEAAHFVSVYAWPGNVRQLKHAIYSAYYPCENGVINIDDFPLYIAQNLNHRAPAEQLGSEPSGVLAQTESSSSVKVRDGCAPASNTRIS